MASSAKTCIESFAVPDGWEVAEVDSTFLKAVTTFGRYWNIECGLGTPSLGCVEECDWEVRHASGCVKDLPF